MRALVYGALLFAIGTLVRADELELAPAPRGLPRADLVRFDRRWDELRTAYRQVDEKLAALHAEFGRTVDEKSPRAGEAKRRLGELQGELDRIYADADTYEAEVKTAAVNQLPEVERELQDLRRQLQGFGFKGTADEFERLRREGKAGVERMKSELLKRLRDLVVERATAGMQDTVLQRLKTLTPADVDRFEVLAKQAETPCPEILRVLRTATAENNPARLAEEAAAFLRLVEREQGLFEVYKAGMPGSVEARQEAALTLLGIATHAPVISDLTTVSRGAYQTGEAWFLYFTLKREGDLLQDSVEHRLAAQKRIGERIEELYATKKVALGQ